MIYQRIECLDELKRLANTDFGIDCFILLNGGCKSSKTISYGNGVWCVDSDITGTSRDFSSDKQLAENSSIISALEHGCLYKY